MLIATSFWGLLIVGIFNLDSLTEPFWYAVAMFPLIIPPVSCIAGIIRGSINLKKYKNARLCLILSIIGFLILDRRVGKRTLTKIKSEFDNQPQWLQQIYLLRFDAELI